MKNLILLFTLLFWGTCFAQTVISTQQDSSVHIDNTVYTLVELMPSFPGGESEMMKFIQKNIKYPEAEKQANISGTCYVTFAVEKDGSLSSVKILRGVPKGPGCDAEAVRVVAMMPKWTPGKQNGKEVRVQFNLPVKFTLRNTPFTLLTDTTFYTSEWTNCSRQISEYYRIVSKQDGKYLVKDFYTKNNQPQMIAMCIALDPLVKEGNCISYSEKGQKLSEGSYAKDKKVGNWVIWNPEEKDSLVVECYSDGTYKNKYVPVNYAYNTKYDVSYQAEVMPAFPGGEFEMMKFIQKNVSYPTKEKNEGISGTCYVTFVVEKDGKITDARILRGVANGPGCDNESLRVVNLMPTWKPGLQFGRPVRVQFNLPIKYTLWKGR